MSTAAIVIDNFLSESQWDTIQSGVTSHLNSTLYDESKDSLYTEVTAWILSLIHI